MIEILVRIGLALLLSLGLAVLMAWGWDHSDPAPANGGPSGPLVTASSPGNPLH